MPVHTTYGGREMDFKRSLWLCAAPFRAGREIDFKWKLISNSRKHPQEKAKLVFWNPRIVLYIFWINLLGLLHTIPLAYLKVEEVA